MTVNFQTLIYTGLIKKYHTIKILLTNRTYSKKAIKYYSYQGKYL